MKRRTDGGTEMWTRRSCTCPAHKHKTAAHTQASMLTHRRALVWQRHTNTTPEAQGAEPPNQGFFLHWIFSALFKPSVSGLNLNLVTRTGPPATSAAAQMSPQLHAHQPDQGGIAVAPESCIFSWSPAPFCSVLFFNVCSFLLLWCGFKF